MDLGRPFLGGLSNVWQNVTDGGEGVKKITESVDVVYGRPLNGILRFGGTPEKNPCTGKKSVYRKKNPYTGKKSVAY